GSFTSFALSRCVRFAPRADIRPMPAFMSAPLLSLLFSRLRPLGRRRLLLGAHPLISFRQRAALCSHATLLAPISTLRGCSGYLPARCEASQRSGLSSSKPFVTRAVLVSLRPRRERPRSRAAKQRDELAPPCMTGKEHTERWRGSVHETASVATGSPQPPWTLVRQGAWSSGRFFHTRTAA